MTSEAGKELVDIIDPYAYKDELVLPKLIINGTNDRYRTIDSLNLYLKGLLGENYVLYVPNSGHGLEDRRRVLKALSAFALSVSKGMMLPRMKVEYSHSQANMELSASPLCFDAWSATAMNMDFRDSRWSSAPVEEIGLREYCYKWDLPKTPMASFIESHFLADGPFPYSLSSQMCLYKP
jgi:PhoPQ-activated pathogenicity-related protein